MSQRVKHSPKDMVRCHRCQRLCLKSSAVAFQGVFYGPDCIKFALSTATESVEDFVRRNLV